MSNLTTRLAPLAIATTLAGVANAGDYVTETRFGIFGAGHNITVTHTEPRVEYFAERFCTTDACGNVYQGTRFTPRVVERAVSKCTTTCIDWDKSILAAPGNLLKAIGDACSTRSRCDTQVYCAPAPRCIEPAMQTYQGQPQQVYEMQPRQGYHQFQPSQQPTLAQPRNNIGELRPIPNRDLQVPPAPTPGNGY
jgi:hypothetical protein